MELTKQEKRALMVDLLSECLKLIETCPQETPLHKPEHEEEPPIVITIACPEKTTLRDAVAGYERVFIGKVLERLQGHKSKTARQLGLSRRQLWEKFRELKMEEADR